MISGEENGVDSWRANRIRGDGQSAREGGVRLLKTQDIDNGELEWLWRGGKSGD